VQIIASCIRQNALDSSVLPSITQLGWGNERNKIFAQQNGRILFTEGKE
jgi:hypothetical protein